MAMSEKDTRLLCDLLESGKLNDWEQGAFQDILDRNNPLSPKQLGMINTKKLVIIDGIPEKEAKLQTAAPDTYDNCRLHTCNEGKFIMVNDDDLINAPVTKKDALIILAWLTQALPDIKQIFSGIEAPTPPPVSATEPEVRILSTGEAPPEGSDNFAFGNNAETVEEIVDEEDPF